jgi:protein required for attachment to host cells
MVPVPVWSRTWAPERASAKSPGMEFSQPAERNRDIMSDRPGRSFESADNARHGMEPPSDPKRLAEADFVPGLASMLDEKLKAGAFDRLVLVAAPQALGDIRKAMSGQLAEAVYGELAKDLTKVPNNELAKHLGEVMAV